MSAYKECPACRAPADLHAAACPRCGRAFQTTGDLGRSTVVFDAAGWPRQKTDLCAALSFICGLIGFVWLLGVVFGPLALILGFVSQVRIGNDRALKGRWMAVVGALLGLVTILSALPHLQAPAAGPTAPAPPTLPAVGTIWTRGVFTIENDGWVGVPGGNAIRCSVKSPAPRGPRALLFRTYDAAGSVLNADLRALPADPRPNPDGSLSYETPVVSPGTVAWEFVDVEY